MKAQRLFQEDLAGRASWVEVLPGQSHGGPRGKGVFRKQGAPHGAAKQKGGEEEEEEEEREEPWAPAQKRGKSEGEGKECGWEWGCVSASSQPSLTKATAALAGDSWHLGLGPSSCPLGTYLKEIMKIPAKRASWYQEVRGLPFVLFRCPSAGG